MRRRALFQALISIAAAIPSRVRLSAQTARTAVDQARLRAVAEAVLPAEIGTEGVTRVVQGFSTWLAEYRGGAETDHGYGFPRLRRTPQSPATRYPGQLDALDRLARTTGGEFAQLDADARRRVVERALREAKIDRLPPRPDGSHVASDLLAYFFDSSEANDLCYRARIGRDTCRGLDGSEERPPSLDGGRA
jgi:hypothetical protein